MAVKTNPWAIGTAALANGGLLALLFLMGLNSTMNHLSQSPPGGNIRLKDFTLFTPPEARPAKGGGGGGTHELSDPVTGRLPRREDSPMTPLLVAVLQNATIAINPAIAVPPEIKLPDNPTLPNIGVLHSANVKLESNGPGSFTGIGTGVHGGGGPGDGNGTGPGANRA